MRNSANQNNPLISIIMPCFNAEAFLKESVESVFNQSYSNVELIVVDDGSTDKSYALLDELTKIYSNLIIFKQKNSGPYPARNFALSQAKGELIAFLDADDYWDRGFLEKLYYALVKNKADISYCGWQNIVEDGENGPPYVPPAYEQGDIFSAFLKGCPWPIHAALVKRPVIEVADGFSTRCFSSMDYDFWIRLSAITQNMTLVPEILAFYRWHDKGQISSIKWRQVLDAWQVRKDFVLANPQLVAHIPTNDLDTLVNSQISKQAYEAFWKRDLVSAQILFRTMLKVGSWNGSDLKYIILSLLPLPLLKWLIKS
jgi:glycosyltransferase involved in cell wall biosynthesis